MGKLSSLLCLPRTPLNDNRTLLRRAKRIFVLMKLETDEYSSFLFSASLDATCLLNTVQPCPIPPEVVMTRGRNEAFSLSVTRAKYLAFFSFSLYRYTCSKALVMFEGAVGWVILTSTKVLSNGLQSPTADISNLA